GQALLAARRACHGTIGPRATAADKADRRAEEQPGPEGAYRHLPCAMIAVLQASERSAAWACRHDLIFARSGIALRQRRMTSGRQASLAPPPPFAERSPAAGAVSEIPSAARQPGVRLAALPRRQPMMRPPPGRMP